MVQPGALCGTIPPQLLRLLAVAIVLMGIVPRDVAAPAWAAICGHQFTAVAPIGPETAVAVRGEAVSPATLRAAKKDPVPDPLDAVLPDIALEVTRVGSAGRGQLVPRAPPRSPDPILRPAAHGPPAFA
jgi:hypothetical protein